MTTNVRKRSDIPAGMFSGTEVFVKNGKAYAFVNGMRMNYVDLPQDVKGAFSRAFKKDWKIVVKLWPNEGVERAFVKWLSCKCGKLDGTPDLDAKTGNIIADENSFCGNCYCAGAGKLCSLPYDLKPYQIATIQLVHRGFTRDQIADHLCLSADAIKSRLNKTKRQLNAVNIAHLSSITPLIPSSL